MGSHILDILRQGIWASLSGGWFYDPYLSIFINTFHLYLWLFLLSFPLILHLTLEPSLMVWILYCAIVGVVFIVVKIMNYKLHHMFDTSEMIEEVDSKSENKGDSSIGVAISSEEPPETIEMKEISSSGNKTSTSIDPKASDVQADTQSEPSRKLGGESSLRKRRSRQDGSIRRASSQRSHRAPLAEMDKDEIDLSLQGAVGGTSKVLTHCPGDSAQEDEDTPSDADDELSVPNTITTKADVEARPLECPLSLPDDSPKDLKSPSESKHSCDADLSDVSPEHKNSGPRKSRRKAHRAQSAVESSEIYSRHSRPVRYHPSLPARPKLDSVINKDTGVSIIRPWSDQTITRTKQMLESDEITVIDFEAMNNAARTFRARTTPVSGKWEGSKRLHSKAEENTEQETSVQKEVDKEFTPHLGYSNSKDHEITRKSSDSRMRSDISSQPVMEVEENPDEISSNGIKPKQKSDVNRKRNTSRSTVTPENTRLNSEPFHDSNRESKLRSRTRNAFSEERYIKKEDDVMVSSQHVGKGGSAMLISSSDDDSDLSFGEVFVAPQKEVKRRKLSDMSDKKSTRTEDKEKIKVRTKHSKGDRKPRPNSAEFAQDTRSLPERDAESITSTSMSLDDSFNEFSANSDILRAAFHDAGTPTSPEDLPHDHHQGKSLLMSSAKREKPSLDLNCNKKLTLESDDSDTDVQSVKSEGEVTEEPSEELGISGIASDLEMMRKQGAIPKHFNKPLPPVPDTSGSQSKEADSPDTKASSPASLDLSDPEEFHRKLIEILNEPAETSAEQIKKFMAVMEAKKNKSSSMKSKSEKEDKSVSAGESGLGGGAALDIDDAAGSKPVTPTEISSLLPDNAGTSDDFRLTRKPGRKRRPAMRQRSPPTSMSLKNNSHFAESHDDTTEGATHLFQDEEGNWYSYTFGDGSAGLAMSLADASESKKDIKEDRWSSSSCASGSMVVVDSLKDEDKALEALRIYDHHHDLGLRGSVDIRHRGGILQAADGKYSDFLAYVDQLLESGRRFDSSSDSDSKDIGGSRDVPQTKHFYKFKLLPKKFIKIYFDRLALLALLDRNLSVIENIIAVMMAVCVGALGALVLAGQFYYDFWIFLFCFIMAGCQYSLMKSVQPDAASPMHGYNHLIVFSRPFYFCVCCGLMLLLDYVGNNTTPHTVYVYGMPFTTSTILLFARDFLRVFLLCLPVIFTAGLLPQVNTFITFALEQIDTHLLGGNATVCLVSSIYCVCRSLVAAGFLYVICYLTLIQLGKTIVDEPDACRNKEFAQTAAFSIFCACLVAMSYHLSRSASDPSVLWMLIKDKVCGEKEEEEEDREEGELRDPLPGKLKTCVSERLQSDLLISIVIMILSFAIHVSTVFIQPLIDDILYFTVAGFGFLIHYLIPQLRKEMPWLCCSHPLLKSQERSMFEATGPAKIMWFEKLYIWMRFVERNGMYTVVVLCALTRSVPAIVCKFGDYFGPLVVTVCSLKLLRFSFSNTPKQHMILAITVLFFKYDARWASETTLIDLFFVAILFTKFCDLYLKMKFIITYIAPWQITWGSAFHAFAQPFSVPHSAMLFLQAGVSAFFSTPLNPFLGSAIFITSYVRPVKFWEKDYNTKRVDHSNTRLSQQLERNTGADDNNLNSIFYEHLTRSLQHSLCGDLLMGRWGNAEQGDIFIMASDSLNALVHIIEMGNGLVTFQLRGLEFRGTYCQQREVEAITEGVEENDGFCCFEPGHLPHFLSLNAAFNQRWLAWEVVVTKYVLEGYSISDNNAASMVGVFDFRKVLIMYYIQSIIYYTVRSPRLEQWLENPTITEALLAMSDENYCDVDPTFSAHVDEDYDTQNTGISRKSFCSRNLDWIQYCASRREKPVDSRRDSQLVSLCFALSLLGRRALGTASHNNASASVEFFLYGLHALFKGDFRITSSRDEWVFADMELLRRVVAPGVRMSLKLHQDHFLISDAYETEESLYDAISHYETSMVISHEADPAWRNAVLSNTPSLLALRNVFDEGSDEYKIIMLNKKYLTFRIVKVNRECVRGLWAGQQQELIFLRNRNPERGSIQNAKQALRNMINSSCDQPIGYPIYVSPLTTSYSSTNEQYTSVIGGEFIIDNVKRFFKNAWQSVRRHCGASCTSGSSAFMEGDVTYSSSCTHQAAASVLGSAGRGCHPTTPVNSPENMTLTSRGNRGSLISTTSSAASKPRSLVTLSGLIGENQQTKESTHGARVKITDISCVYDNMNLGRRIDVLWPNDEWRNNGGKNAWAGWYPTSGMEGLVVHRWSPCHRDIVKRSHVDKTILLVQIGERYVPIGEQGVQFLMSDREVQT